MRLRVAAHAVPVRVQRLRRPMFRLPALYSVPAILPAMKTDIRPAKWAPAGQPILPGPADEYVSAIKSGRPCYGGRRFHHPE